MNLNLVKELQKVNEDIFTGASEEEHMERNAEMRKKVMEAFSKMLVTTASPNLFDIAPAMIEKAVAYIKTLYPKYTSNLALKKTEDRPSQRFYWGDDASLSGAKAITKQLTLIAGEIRFKVNAYVSMSHYHSDITAPTLHMKLASIKIGEKHTTHTTDLGSIDSEGHPSDDGWKSWKPLTTILDRMLSFNDVSKNHNRAHNIIKLMNKEYPKFASGRYGDFERERLHAYAQDLVDLLKENIDERRSFFSINEDQFLGADNEEVDTRRKEMYAERDRELEKLPLRTLEELVSKGSTEIWYMKHMGTETTHGRDADLSMGYAWCLKKGCQPDPKNLEETHVLLGKISSTNLEDIFFQLQAENWSPNGEARKLIMTKGLRHTSMSVGDIIKLADGRTFMADNAGFVDLTNPDEKILGEF